MDAYLREIEGKAANDIHHRNSSGAARRVWVPGAVIVGGGPSGLAAAACLKDKGVPSVVIERSNCIASLWQLRTYDRLRLHLPKQFCELPMMSFPPEFPSYPTRQQFVLYLESYAKRFEIRPVFERAVTSAEYDKSLGFWRVRTAAAEGSAAAAAGEEEVEYVCRWLIAATGENAEAVVPVIEGAEEFGGEMFHTTLYRNGNVYKGKKVLVVGCGNSGMEVCLDLCNHKAIPSLAVRSTVHILPHEMMGRSTFGVSMWLLKWLPVRIVDRLLLAASWLILGDTGRIGIERPEIGPLELKNMCGKTPVLDVGTLDRIKSGHIKVRPNIERLRHKSVEFVDGSVEDFDAIVLATGYKSNVPCWLKENEMFSEKDGFPKEPFPNGWKGKYGLYAAGFSKRGLHGASVDARNIADDIEKCWMEEAKHLSATSWPFSMQKHNIISD